MKKREVSIRLDTSRFFWICAFFYAVNNSQHPLSQHCHRHIGRLLAVAHLYRPLVGALENLFSGERVSVNYQRHLAWCE